MDNLNFNIYGFKICKNSLILGTFKLNKIQILNL